MNFREYQIILDQELDIQESNFACYLEDDIFNEQYILEIKTEKERRIVRARKAALQIATKGQINFWDMRQKARWLARFQFKYQGGEKGRFIKREKPLNWKQIFLKMKKAKKTLKKFGTKIRRKAQFQLKRTRRLQRGKAPGPEVAPAT